MKVLMQTMLVSPDAGCACPESTSIYPDLACASAAALHDAPSRRQLLHLCGFGAALAGVALLAGCGVAPPRATGRRTVGQGTVRRSTPEIEVRHPLQIDPKLREEAVARAMLAINTPYRYGGSTLAGGFDCSGLVFYVFGALVSQPMPRSTLQWARASLPVAEEHLQRGDFVFFNTSGASFSHMGIYVGERQFVHAPSSGKVVRTDSLDGNYYAARFDGGRSAFAA